MAAPKKSAKEVLVPVVRVKHIEIRTLGTRQTAEFEDELRGLFAQGYKVYGKTVGKSLLDGERCVTLQLGKSEDWTFEEFIADTNDMIRDGGVVPHSDYPSVGARRW